MKNALVMLLVVFPLGAQQPSAPPAVLRIFREEIKEGKAADHEKTEAVFMQAAAKQKYPSHIIGLTSLTGTALAVFLEGHDTFASIADSEAVMDTPEFGAIDAADAQLRINQRSMIARYRPDLSYAADQINLPKTRYFSIETVHVRAGHLEQHAKLIETLIAAEKNAGNSQHDTRQVATYQVVSGAPNGTFLVLQPMASLKSLDEGQQRQRLLFQAMGESGRTAYEKAISDSIESEESLLFAVNPQMSYVPKEWVTADPDFWGSKPVTTKKATGKQAASK